MPTKTGRKLSFATDVPTSLKKLRNAIEKLGAKLVDYNYTHSLKDSDAFIIFEYKGQKYHFKYSQSRAEYFGYKIPQSKDVFIALVNGILDLTRVAERGVFDFGQVVQGFKAIEFIEVPKWAEFMGFNTRPRNMMEVEDRFKELSKGSMNPNTNPDDFMKLQNARELARQYFKVE